MEPRRDFTIEHVQREWKNLVQNNSLWYFFSLSGVWRSAISQTSPSGLVSALGNDQTRLIFPTVSIFLCTDTSRVLSCIGSKHRNPDDISFSSSAFCQLVTICVPCACVQPKSSNKSYMKPYHSHLNGREMCRPHDSLRSFALGKLSDHQL